MPRCVEIHEEESAPFMCQLFVFAHPQLILKTDSQANRGAKRETGGETNKQSDRQAD